VFPVRYKLDSYILFKINSVFKGLSEVTERVGAVMLRVHFQMSLSLSFIFLQQKYNDNYGGG
jgi:hypothetical protein